MMNRLKRVAALSVLVLFAGCASQQAGCKSMQSSVSGLDRVVTLYDCNGGVIKTYEGRMLVGDTNNGGGIYIDIVGKQRIFIDGTYTVEEK